MNQLDITLENCFGIGKLKHVFDFTLVPTKTFLIYAPNGTMKTSFAKTLALIANDDSSQTPNDRVFPHRPCVFNVLVDGTPISPESILVINAEDKNFDASEKISSFIARRELKEKYDKIYQELDAQKSELIKKLKSISKSTDCEGEILATFQTENKESVFEILSFVAPDLTDTPINYSFKYNDIFDQKGAVQKFLIKNEVLLDQYIEKYEEVLSTSTFFKRSVNSFGTYQAGEILKSVKGDSFFHAGHKFSLDDGKVITSAKELQETVQLELDRIINDGELRKAFEKVDKEITGNTEMRAFHKVLEKDNALLLELKDYNGFKRKVWIDYLSQMKTEVEELVSYYSSQKSAIEALLAEAQTEVEIWREIIDKFNSRFYVPFIVSLGNQADILLKENVAILEFEYYDRGDGPARQSKDNLLNILSKGEQRAYYILQFLFEIESRRALGTSTLLIFDDIADSFDYKNKFAIIEYLKELHYSNGFYTIILTHNFDFYRTVGSRLGMDRRNIFMVTKNTNSEITLVTGQYIKGAYKHFLTKFNDQAIFISLLPFARNIIEYSEGEGSPEYMTLTSCLHIKADTDTINATQLLGIYNRKLPTTSGKPITFGTKKIKDLVYETAEMICGQANPDEVALENKIVLSMAVRLRAEEYMLSKLPRFNLADVTSNQTKAIYDDFLQIPGLDREVLLTMGKVIIMTPENIHVNAFMYEPLIDMTVLHLKELYEKLKMLP